MKLRQVVSSVLSSWIVLSFALVSLSQGQGEPGGCSGIWAVGIHHFDSNQTVVVTWGTWRDWAVSGVHEFTPAESEVQFRFRMDLSESPNRVLFYMDELVDERWVVHESSILGRVFGRCSFQRYLEQHPNEALEFSLVSKRYEREVRLKLSRVQPRR